MWTIDKSGRINPLLRIHDIPEPFNLPRQQLPKVWWHIGVLDVVRTDVVTQTKSLSGTIILPLIIDRESHADIDTLLDFERAEQLVQKINCVKPRTVN